MQWQFFANLYTTLVAPLMDQLQVMLGDVCATIQPIVLGLIGVWLLTAFFELANQTKTLPQIMKEFYIAIMVVFFIQIGQYNQFVVALFLKAIPNTIGTALGGQGSPVAGLDKLLASTLVATAKAFQALPNYSLKSIPLAGALLFSMGFSAICICFCFGVFMVSAITNVIAVVVGPIFLGLGAVPQTRRFAFGWLAVLVGGCVTQLMAVAVIQLLSGAETLMIKNVVISAADSDSNVIAMLWGLCQVALLLWLSKMVVQKLPAIAQAIGGGVYSGTAGLHSMTFGIAGAAIGAAAGAARGAAMGSAGGTAGRSDTGAAGRSGAAAIRASSPTGQSLSGRG